MAKRGSRLQLPWERSAGVFGRLLGGGQLRLLVVLALIGAGSWLLWGSASRRQKVDETRRTIASVESAIDRFRADVGRCPLSPNELAHPPRTRQRYLRDIPKDAWGRDFFIACPGHFDPDSADVISAGPSGSFTTDDNVY